MNLTASCLHHSYVILGNLENAKAELRDFFDTQVTGMQWLEYPHEKLGIDEVRDLREILTEQSGGRFIVIPAERFPHEAQNAFLKLLEEPAVGVHIFLILPPQINILDTIKSRTMVIEAESDKKSLIFSVKDFLTMPFPKRLDMIDTMHKERKGGEEGSFQAFEVQEFLTALEQGLAILFQKNKNPMFAESFAAIRDARGWAKQTGFPQKNILEYVAMIVPDFGKK